MTNDSDSTSWHAVGYREAVVTARDLCDPLEESRGGEYSRGQVELIADLWAKRGMDMGERKNEVELDIFGPQDTFLRERGVGPVGERDHNIMAMNLEPVNAQELDELRDILEWMEDLEGNAKLRLSEARNLLRGIVKKRSHGPFPLPELPSFENIERRLQHLESEDSRIETLVQDLERELKEAQTLIGDLTTANYDRIRDVNDLDTRVTNLESPTTDS